MILNNKLFKAITFIIVIAIFSLFQSCKVSQSIYEFDDSMTRQIYLELDFEYFNQFRTDQIKKKLGKLNHKQMDVIPCQGSTYIIVRDNDLIKNKYKKYLVKELCK